MTGGDGPVLAWRYKLAYGVGHVYNDLCAAVWFSYTLLYLQVQVMLSTDPITSVTCIS